MAATQPSQAFYSLTIVPPSAPTAAVCCNVLPGYRQQDQQIFEARGSRLYLRHYREDETRTTMEVHTVFEQDAFSNVRSIIACRVPGEDLDHIFIVTDSGRIGMYKFDADANRLKQVHLETFGKSGIRRTVPGQYVAADPTGRCLMMASTEKNKVVYMFQRTPQGAITISSPHEANSWETLTFDLCGIDVAWENPQFAALEVEYTELEADEFGEAYQNREKMLTFYTVDLGINHVVKDWSDSVDYTANKLFGVPGGNSGPSGVLVCARGRIYYRHKKLKALSIAIPRRIGPFEDPNRDRIIVDGLVHVIRGRSMFFFLLQTDDGDVFKLSFLFENEDAVKEPTGLELRYYDTLPIASQLLLLRKGFLIVNSESGPSKIYHVDSLAEDPEEEPEYLFRSGDSSADPAVKLKPLTFRHRRLANLTLMNEIPAMHPLTRTRVDNLVGDDAPQILAIQGTGNQSCFKMIRHGQPVIVEASVEQGNAPWDGVFALKDHIDDEYCKWVLVSTKAGDRTLVLNLDGNDISSTEDSVFMQGRPTLLAALMGISTRVQVWAKSVRSVQASDQLDEWFPENSLSIVCAGANSRQLLVGLSSAELAFFFLGEDGHLSELQERPEMSGAITAIGLANTPVGQQQARFGVVGCDDLTVRVLSIHTDSPLEVRSIQAVSDVPISIVVVEMLDPNSNTNVNVVHIGLRSGVYLRAIIDEVTGELSEVRSKFLGARPCRIFPAVVKDQQCVILSSTKPWIGYHHPVSKQYTVTPLITPWVESVTEFSSVSMTGLCAVANNELRFFEPTELGTKFVTDKIDLPYTPRAFTRNPATQHIYVISADGNTMSPELERTLVASSQQQPYLEGAQVGHPRSEGHWASCVQVLDPVVEKAITCTLDIESNEAALCLAVVPFESRDWENYLIVGTGKNINAFQKGHETGTISVYKISQDGRTLTFEYKTAVDLPVRAVCAFKGKMAIGMGNEVLLYDLGMKNALRKARGEVVGHTVVSLESLGERLIVGDVRDSVSYVYYKEEENRLVSFVDDTVSRWTTCASMVDYDTCAGGDKFGNLWVVRCPDAVSQDVDDPNRQSFILSDRAFMNGAPYRLDLRAHYYCQDIPTSVQRTPLLAGGQDVIYWSGIQGTIGMLVPFVSRRDVDMFNKLEVQMRTEDPALGGRDHLAYRSYYAAVRSVVDGDLCERFMELSYDQKQRIAAELERPISDIEKKVQEMRSRVAF